MKLKLYKPKPILSKFVIETIDGQLLYTIKRRSFLIRGSWVVYDISESKIANIAICFSLLVPKAKVTIAGGEKYYIKRKLSFENNYEIDGSLWKTDCSMYAHNIAILDESDRPIISASKVNGSWHNEYTLNVHQEDYLVRALCLIFAINALTALMRKNNN